MRKSFLCFLLLVPASNSWHFLACTHITPYILHILLHILQRELSLPYICLLDLVPPLLKDDFILKLVIAFAEVFLTNKITFTGFRELYNIYIYIYCW